MSNPSDHYYGVGASGDFSLHATFHKSSAYHHVDMGGGIWNDIYIYVYIYIGAVDRKDGRENGNYNSGLRFSVTVQTL